MNNIISFEDSEKPVNEAKEDKEEKDDSSDEEKKDDSSSEEADDSDNGDSEEAEEEDKPKPTGVANENPNVPTKWIFLKITLKK